MRKATLVLPREVVLALADEASVDAVVLAARFARLGHGEDELPGLPRGEAGLEH
jgi:hypothetical protein